MTALDDQDPRDQYERTLLAWRRTALSLVATGLLVALAAREAGQVALTVMLAGTAGVVAYVWLSHEERIGAAGVVLVLGVVLLGVVALLAVV